MELLTDPDRASEARALLTPTYLQHNPNLPDGPDAIINLINSDLGQRAKATMELAGKPMFVAEGDFVVMVQPIKRPDPQRPGESYTLWWFDMWRVEDGRLAEHWDAAEKWPSPEGL